jgi:hypothetical protein
MIFRVVCGCLLLLAALCPAAPAQVYTERMHAPDVEGGRIALGGDLTLQSGHVALFEVGVSARGDGRRTPHCAFLAGGARYGIQDDAPVRDRTCAHLRYNYRLRPWLVAEPFAQLGRDGVARLRPRSRPGT